MTKRYGYLFGVTSWWRHQMETFSALLAICAGQAPAPGAFPSQRPVPRSFDIFFDLRLNKRLSKQSWGWWFETLSRPLWRHSNGLQKWIENPRIYQNLWTCQDIWTFLLTLEAYRCNWLQSQGSMTYIAMCYLSYQLSISQCLSPNDFGYTIRICYQNAFEVYFEPNQCCIDVWQSDNGIWSTSYQWQIVDYRKISNINFLPDNFQLLKQSNAISRPICVVSECSRVQVLPGYVTKAARTQNLRGQSRTPARHQVTWKQRLSQNRPAKKR